MEFGLGADVGVYPNIVRKHFIDCFVQFHFDSIRGHWVIKFWGLVLKALSVRATWPAYAYLCMS